MLDNQPNDQDVEKIKDTMAAVHSQVWLKKSVIFLLKTKTIRDKSVCFKIVCLILDLAMFVHYFNFYPIFEIRIIF